MDATRWDATRSATPAMGDAPTHGVTMGYASGPFRTEDQNPTPSGNAVDDFLIGVFLIRVFRVIRGDFGADAITSAMGFNPVG